MGYSVGKFQVGDKIRIVEKSSMLLLEYANLTGVIEVKVSVANQEPCYTIKLSNGHTTVLSEWFLRNYSKLIKFYKYGI